MPEDIRTRQGSQRVNISAELYVDGEGNVARSYVGVVVISVDDCYFVGDAIVEIFVDGDDKIVARLADIGYDKIRSCVCPPVNRKVMVSPATSRMVSVPLPTPNT